MSGIQGFPSNQKVPLGTGITNNFATVIPVDPNRSAIDIPRFAFRVDDALVARTAGATTGIDSSSGEKLFWVNDPSTPARVGDFVRFENGAAAFLEIPIVKVETNRFLLSVNSGALPAVGDTFFIMRYATQRVDDTGSQLVVASPGPSQFVLDGVDTEVEQDTVTPANSRPFPVAQLNTDGTVNDPLKKRVAFLKNGSEVVVTEDTVTPSNNIPLPVKLTSVTGDINITAGDLNVQLSDQGANPDVTRIGDGTNQLGISAANEAKVIAAQLPTTLGQTTKANSLSVTLPSDLDPIVVRSGLVPTEYDEIALTYVGAGLDGEGQVATAVYKLATVTVATLTLSYNANDKLVGVARS